MLFLVKKALLRWHNLFPESKLIFTDALSDPRCLEPMKPGDCWDYVVKWYYDKNGNSCGQFWYGGCNGTNNRFETEKECRETCIDRWKSKLSPSGPHSITSFPPYVLFYINQKSIFLFNSQPMQSISQGPSEISCSHSFSLLLYYCYLATLEEYNIVTNSTFVTSLFTLFSRSFIILSRTDFGIHPSVTSLHWFFIPFFLFYSFYNSQDCLSQISTTFLWRETLHFGNPVKLYWLS